MFFPPLLLPTICSSKVTEEPSQLELDLVQLFLTQSLKSSSAGFRQRCVVRLKKFFLRLKESARKHHGKNKDRSGVRKACDAVALSVKTLVAALYPGAPFQVPYPCVISRN